MRASLPAVLSRAVAWISPADLRFLFRVQITCLYDLDLVDPVNFDSVYLYEECMEADLHAIVRLRLRFFTLLARFARRAFSGPRALTKSPCARRSARASRCRTLTSRALSTRHCAG